jgi:hypothetical protein
MAGAAGTNVDPSGLIWDPALPDVQLFYKELGIRGTGRIKHLVGGYRTVIIPTASVLTLNSVPIQIVPAAGAGTLIVPRMMVASLVYNSATYACNAAGVSLKYGTAGAGTSTGFTLSQAFIQSSTGTNVQIVNQSSAATYLPATTDFNVPLTLIASTSDPTTGDSALYVRVYFRIIAGLPFTNPCNDGL